MSGLVHIVDDDLLLRQSLGILLLDNGFEVNEFASAEEFLAKSPPTVPSCIVLDIQMSGLTGLELRDALSDADFSPPIVYLTGTGSVPDAVESIKQGAVDVLLKPVQSADLIAAITKAIDTSKRRVCAAKELNLLTPKEKKIAGFVREGFQSKEIAEKLGISVRTVEWHRKNINEKTR